MDSGGNQVCVHTYPRRCYFAIIISSSLVCVVVFEASVFGASTHLWFATGIDASPCSVAQLFELPMTDFDGSKITLEFHVLRLTLTSSGGA